MGMPAVETRRWTAVEVQNLPVESRVIERWLGGREHPEVLTETLHWQLPGHPDPFTLDVAAFFAEVHGEQ